MAAGTFLLYNKAILKILDGTITLPGAVRVALVGSASNYATSTISLWGSVTDEVTSVTNSYSTSGQALATESVVVGASAGQYKFDAGDVTWTATGNPINSIRAAVLFMSGAAAGSCHVLGWVDLTTAAFNLATGNTLTIQWPATGIFTANNA